MTVKARLASHVSQTRGLGDIAIVANHDIHVEIESAQPDKPDHIVEADRRAAGLPPCDRGLGGVCTRSEFLLRQTGAATRFADEISTVRTHEPNITDLLYSCQGESLDRYHIVDRIWEIDTDHDLMITRQIHRNNAVTLRWQERCQQLSTHTIRGRRRPVEADHSPEAASLVSH